MSNFLLKPEEQQQIAFVEYLRLRRIPHTAIPNSTWTPSNAQKRKNTIMGLVAGLPDLLLVIDDRLVFVEMKRPEGGIVSKSQQRWIDLLNNCEWVSAHVCRWCAQAVDLVEHFLSP